MAMYNEMPDALLKDVKRPEELLARGLKMLPSAPFQPAFLW
ncbi:MAG: hypothetical protein RLN99_20110 [Kiloniellaceae bacterium]